MTVMVAVEVVIFSLLHLVISGHQHHYLDLLLNVEYAKVESFQIFWLLVSDGIMKMNEWCFSFLLSLSLSLSLPHLIGEFMHAPLGFKATTFPSTPSYGERRCEVSFVLELIGVVFLLSIRNTDPWLRCFNFMDLRTSINYSFSTTVVHCRSSI